MFGRRMPTVFVAKDVHCSNQRDDSKSTSLTMTYLFFILLMTIKLKRRDGVRQSASLPSTRTVTSWLGVWKPVDFERKYSLEKVYRSHNGFEITTNLTFISFGNNLCCRRINHYSSKGKLTHNAVSRCVQMSGSHFKLLRFSSPIISQFRVYLREIVDFYKGIFARIAKMLSIAVLNLLCQFLSPLSMQMSAS